MIWVAGRGKEYPGERARSSFPQTRCWLSRAGVRHFTEFGLFRIARISKCLCKHAGAIGSHAQWFKASVLPDTKASNSREVVRLAEGSVVKAEEALQCFFGSLPAMIGRLTEQRRIGCQQDPGGTQVVRGLGEPRSCLCDSVWFRRHGAEARPARRSRAATP